MLQLLWNTGICKLADQNSETEMIVGAGAYMYYVYMYVVYKLIVSHNCRCRPLLNYKMTLPRNLCPPEGFIFDKLISIENALALRYGDTGDERYKMLCQRVKNISNAITLHIKDRAEKERVTVHGATIEIPILFPKQTPQIQMMLFNLGYKAHELLAQCVNDWVLRHLYRLKIESMRKNLKRDREREKSERKARKYERTKKEPEAPAPSTKINLLADSTSSSHTTISRSFTPQHGNNNTRLYQNELPNTDNFPTIIPECSRRPATVSTINLMNPTSPTNPSTKDTRSTHYHRDELVPDYTRHTEAVMTPLSQNSEQSDNSESIYSEDSELPGMEKEQAESPRNRARRHQPLSSEGDKELYEREEFQSRKRKIQENKAIANLRAENNAAKKTRGAKVKPKNEIIESQNETPVLHTVKCAPGWQWHIELSRPYRSKHSEYTFECWKIKTPPGLY